MAPSVVGSLGALEESKHRDKLNKVSNNSIFFIYLTAIILGGCNSEKKEETTDTTIVATIPDSKIINYGVIKTYPHDTTSFTEGLLFYKGKLYESTGSPEELQQTRSLMGEVDLTTVQINQKVELDRKKYFGEGIVFLNSKLFWLTYKTKTAFIYDAATFQQLGTFTIPSQEGWGLTTDGTHLIMSDGTHKLTFLDTASYAPVKILEVYDQNKSLVKINELEFINGFLYANIYTTALIVKIDPGTGQVVGKLDLTSIMDDAKSRYPKALEMNGIAFNSTTNQVYITGKLWPNIYQIQFNY